MKKATVISIQLTINGFEKFFSETTYDENDTLLNGTDVEENESLAYGYISEDSENVILEKVTSYGFINEDGEFEINEGIESKNEIIFKK